MKRLLTVLVMAGLVFSAADAALARPRGRSGNISPATKQVEREEEVLVPVVDELPTSFYMGKQGKSMVDPSNYGYIIIRYETEESKFNASPTTPIYVHQNLDEKVVKFVVSTGIGADETKVEFVRDGDSFTPVNESMATYVGKQALVTNAATDGLRNSIKNYGGIIDPVWDRWDLTSENYSWVRIVSVTYNELTTQRVTETVESPSTGHGRQRPDGGSEGGAGGFQPSETITDSSTPLASNTEIIDEDVPLTSGLFGLNIPLSSLPETGESNMLAMLYAGLALSLVITGASAVALRKCRN